MESTFRYRTTACDTVQGRRTRTAPYKFVQCRMNTYSVVRNHKTYVTAKHPMKLYDKWIHTTSYCIQIFDDDVCCFDVHIVYHGSILQDAIMVDYVNIEAAHASVTDLACSKSLHWTPFGDVWFSSVQCVTHSTLYETVRYSMKYTDVLCICCHHNPAGTRHHIDDEWTL